jgi:Do/DeqQ family serine protease
MKTNYVQLVLVALLTSFSTILIYRWAGNSRPPVILQEANKPVAQFTKKGTASPIDFTEAAGKATPMVVHITTTQGASRQNSRQRQDVPDLFREFFGDDLNGWQRGGNGAPRQMPQSSGSGVIISADGYIVTNNHVIDNASEIEVVLSDKRTYKAEVMGTAPTTDLAVIKINGKDLPAISFGDSDEVKVGEWVLAVGNPFNLESTVTAGIVSAKARSIDLLRRSTGDAIESFIQTDAAVNPGNSGGALINTAGELIGINTAIATQTGSFSGYSFAVPSNIVKKVIRDLMEYGSIQRGYLGLSYLPEFNSKIAEEKGIEGISEGVYVQEVTPDGGAKQAGVQAGDVIVGMNGKRIKSGPALLEEVARFRPNDKVKLELYRNGTRKTVEVTLKAKDGSTNLTSRKNSEALRGLGAELAELSANDKAKLRVKNGIKVTSIGQGKLRRTGMQEGFIITSLNDEPIKSVEDFTQKLEKVKGSIVITGVYPDEQGEFSYGFMQ